MFPFVNCECSASPRQGYHRSGFVVFLTSCMCGALLMYRCVCAQLPFIAAVNNSIPTMAGVPCAWEQIDARVRQLPRSAEVTRHSLASTTRTPHLKGGLVQSAANSTRPMSSGAAQNTKELRTPSVVVHLPTFDPEQVCSVNLVEYFKCQVLVRIRLASCDFATSRFHRLTQLWRSSFKLGNVA